MADLALDLAASTFNLRTRAEGMFSRLAHDLEIAAEGFSGEVAVEGDRWTATVRFPVRMLRVVGVLRGDNVDRGVLSKKDRAEIERRLAREIIRVEEVVVEASGDSHASGEARIRIGDREERVPLSLVTEPRRDGELAAEGKGKASLRALGIPEVKGPLGAFRVSDTVELSFWVMLAPA
jgi:hypothetical protein